MTPGNLRNLRNLGNQPQDYRQMLKLAKFLLYGGLAVLALALLTAGMSEVGSVPVNPLLLLLCLGVGLCGTVGGMILAWTGLRCPHCKESLLPGGRLPKRLPENCPHCGKPL